MRDIIKHWSAEFIAWEQIYPIWRDRLWPDRKNAITSASAMDMCFGHNIEFLNQPAWFVGVYYGDNLVGVNSFHKNTDHVFRSRGLWVDEAYRGNGIASVLLKKTIRESYKMGASILWSFPRKSSFPVYKAMDFDQYSEWNDDHQFGPNCYAMTVLAKNPAVYWNWNSRGTSE